MTLLGTIRDHNDPVMVRLVTIMTLLGKISDHNDPVR